MNALVKEEEAAASHREQLAELVRLGSSPLFPISTAPGVALSAAHSCLGRLESSKPQWILLLGVHGQTSCGSLAGLTPP